MSISLRKLGLAAGVTVLLSGASASGAFAAVTVSLSGTTLEVTNTGTVNSLQSIATNGSGFEINELNNDLVAGPGITAAVTYSTGHWVVVPTASVVTISDIEVTGSASGDAINASGVTNVPVTIYGGAGNDFLTGGAGADTLSGQGGADTLTGGNGNDSLTGGSGTDTLKGGNGDDLLYANDGAADTVDGGNDYDTVWRDASLDTVSNVEVYH